MTFLFVLIGAAVTWMLADAWSFGWEMTLVLLGGVIGWLFARSAKLATRVELLERSLRSLATAAVPVPPAALPTTTSAQPPMEATPTTPPRADRDDDTRTPLPIGPVPATTVASTATVTSDWSLPSTPATPAVPPPPRPPARPGVIETTFGAVKRWFSVGNVPVKVGMLVLFAGVAALLKYAADAGWFTLPIEFRVAGIALAAIAALVFGWRQRHQRSAFGLSLQGGAIGILILTVFAAFQRYNLLPAGAAFALLILIVAGTGVLAVLQNAMALAVLGILAGFAAPILISTGSGNHVALFAYYAVLNVAVFVIAWMRPWRLLNLLGFFFTYAVATAWEALSYQPEKFASTEPFLILFFVIYLLVPILYARKREPTRDFIDGSLVFGNPLIAFALQAALLRGNAEGLALSALAMALIYAVLAFVLLRRTAMRVLGEAHAILAVGFATLAVPLALSAGATACTFALEGAALVWLGWRQGRRLPRWTGLLLQGLAAFAWMVGSLPEGALPVLNGLAISALLIALAGFMSAALYHRAGSDGRASLLLTGWGLLWWAIAWLHEIERHVPADSQADAVLGLVAVSVALAAFAWSRWSQNVHAWIAALGMPLAIVIALRQADDHLQPFADWGLGAWLAFAVGGALTLRWIATHAAAAVAMHGWLWAWTVAFSLLLHWFALDHALASGWLWALSALPLLLLATGSVLKPRLVGWPLGAAFEHVLPSLHALLLVALSVTLIGSLFDAGGSTPLPFLPLINPLELMQLALLLLIAKLLATEPIRGAIGAHRTRLLAAAGFVLISVATLRGVHQLGGQPWDAALAWSRLAQTSLTVVWSLLGMAAWIVGSRRGNRTLWLAGALLMGIVLVKLLLVDRNHLGNLYGIASFIAYGLLCTVIGYLAPAPAKPSVEETHP